MVFLLWSTTFLTMLLLIGNSWLPVKGEINIETCLEIVCVFGREKGVRSRKPKTGHMRA